MERCDGAIHWGVWGEGRNKWRKNWNRECPWTKLKIFRESQKLFPKWHSPVLETGTPWVLSKSTHHPSLQNVLGLSQTHLPFFSPNCSLFLSMILSVLVKYTYYYSDTNCWVHWRDFSNSVFFPWCLDGFVKSNTYWGLLSATHLAWLTLFHSHNNSMR